MIPYFLLSLSPIFICGVANCYQSNRNKKRFLIICSLLFIFILGFRSRYIGSGDSNNYYNMYQRAIYSNNWNEYYLPYGVEVGFQFFVWICSRIVRNPQFIFLISVAIYMISISRFVYDNSEDPVLSLILYCTLGLMIFELQGMRQAIAMSICVLSYSRIKQRNFWKFLIYIVIAAMFHRTAIVFLPVFFIYKLKLNAKTILALIVVCVLLLVSLDKILDFANNLFETNYNQPVQSGGIINSFVQFAIVLYALLWNKEMKSDKKESSLFYISLLCAFVYILRYFGTLAVERISFYFSFGQIALIPNTLYQMPKHDRGKARFLIIILSIVLLYFHLKNSAFIPFKLCFKNG